MEHKMRSQVITKMFVPFDSSLLDLWGYHSFELHISFLSRALLFGFCVSKPDNEKVDQENLGENGRTPNLEKQGTLLVVLRFAWIQSAICMVRVDRSNIQPVHIQNEKPLAHENLVVFRFGSIVLLNFIFEFKLGESHPTWRKCILIYLCTPTPTPSSTPHFIVSHEQEYETTDSVNIRMRK